jgi:hypothetical protein
MLCGVFTFAQEAIITTSKRINNEEFIFAILLILILALLFCPNPIEKELRGIKQKNMLIRV